MSDLAPGQVLGDRFEIVGVLGRGGTASVWLAFDRVRGERIALKVLHEHLGGQAAMRARLRREVQAAGRLRHPAALVAFDLHEVGGRLALAMPLHPGRTLQHQVQADGPLSAKQLEELATAILGALAEAHRHGVVHRDVTPANILVDRELQGMLTDFGLAATGDARTGTGTGALGTSGYAAPEIWQGERTDPRIDLYGLGATLYFAATGKGPFDAANPMGTLQRQLAEDQVPLGRARPDLPGWLAAEISGWFARDPARRPSGARDALARLSARPAPSPVATLGRRALPEPVGLAAGDWRVEVREPSRRKTRRPPKKGRMGVGGAIDELAERAGRGIGDWLGLPTAREPEEALADVVAELAGLPPGALAVPDTLYEPRFLLVDGVSRRAAEGLARRARALGFRASAAQRVTSAQKAPLYLTLVGIAVFVGVGSDHAPQLLIACLVLALVLRGSWQERALPLAYPDLGAAIRPELADKYGAAPVVAPVAGRVPPPLAVATPRPPSLSDGVLADLDALKGTIDAGDLPDAAASDLRRTVKGLRERAVGLAESARLREDALRGAGTEAVIQRLAERLERLRTLERAGEAVDRGELARLETTLADQHATEDARAGEEQALARQLGELLEIGAVAARTRRALLDQDAPLESVARLREQLRVEAAATGAARGEVRSRRGVAE